MKTARGVRLLQFGHHHLTIWISECLGILIFKHFIDRMSEQQWRDPDPPLSWASEPPGQLFNLLSAVKLG